MGRCKSCRFWEPLVESDGYVCLTNVKLGECRRTKEFWEAVEDDPDSDNVFAYRLKRDNRKDFSFTKDSSDYYSRLLTRLDFGCVLHESKNKSNG